MAEASLLGRIRTNVSSLVQIHRLAILRNAILAEHTACEPVDCRSVPDAKCNR